MHQLLRAFNVHTCEVRWTDIHLSCQVLEGAAPVQGWISSSTKTGRPLVEIRTLTELRAAGVNPVVNTAVPDPTPSLEQVLKSLDRDEGPKVPRRPVLQPAREVEEEEHIDPEEVWKSFTNLARSTKEEKREPASKAADPYPAFMYIQEPSPEYRNEVHERRLRLMAQEKARRKARNRTAAPPEEPILPQPSTSSRSRPQPTPAPEPVPEYVAPAQAERFAEASFAARVARVARENPNLIGQRQSQSEDVLGSHSMGFRAQTHGMFHAASK